MLLPEFDTVPVRYSVRESRWETRNAVTGRWSYHGTIRTIDVYVTIEGHYINLGTHEERIPKPEKKRGK